MNCLQSIKEFNREKWSELFYFAFFGLLFFAKGIGLYDGQKWFYIFLIPAILCWIAKMIVSKWEIKEIAVVFFFLGIAGISSYLSKDKSALIVLMTIVGIKDIRLDRFWRFCLCVWTAAFWGAIVLSLLGLWPSVRLMHNKAGVGFVLRDSLGMTHPNVLFISYMIFISLLFLVFRWKGKKAIVPLVFTCFGGAFIFLYAFSYTGLMCLVAFIILLAYFSFRSNITKFEKVLILAIMPFSVAFSLITPLVIGTEGKVFAFFYKVFNTRFYMTYLYLNNYPLRVFGQEISQAGTWSADCSYLYGLLNYGVLLFALLLIILFVTILKLLKNGREIELAIVLSLCVAGIMEPFMFNFSFKNLMFPIMGGVIYSVLDEKPILYGEEENTPFITFFQRIKDVCTRKWKVLLITFVLGTTLGGVFSSMVVHYQPYIIIQRSLSDYVVDKQTYEIFGELNQDIVDNAWVIGIDQENENASTEKCYVFEGQPIKYITVRTKITFSLAIGFLCGVVLLAWRMIKDKNASNN